MQNLTPTDIRQKLTPYFRTKTQVLAVYLFGSLAEGVPLPISDIDVAVAYLDDPPPSERVELKIQLERDISRILATDAVDVELFTRDMSLPLAQQILLRGKVIYSANDEMRLDRETLMRHKIFDFQPILASTTSAMQERLSQGTYGSRS